MVETVVIDGKAYAQTLREQVAKDVQTLYAQKGIVAGLAVVLVGDNPASEVYVANKVKFSREVGIRSFERRLPAEITEADLIAEVESLNRNPDVHGILVQLPLPKHIHESRVLNTIDPAKDVDGFHPVNAGKLLIGEESLIPCTPMGCVMLLKSTLGDMSGKHAVVIGRSNIVGKPVSLLLLRENCTVTIAHSRTLHLPEVVKAADIVVAAVGQPEMVKGSWIKQGATVIDVGINRIEADGGKTRLVGDVAYQECLGVAQAITPVPGGVGPMTIACLLANTVKAATNLK